MSWLKPIALTGRYCTLAPLENHHHDELLETIKDGELWNLWYTLIPKPEDLRKEIDRRLNLQKQELMLPFSTIDNATGKIVGATTFLNADTKNKHLEIGGTWLCKSAQHTPINTESKLLLLAHAFESLHCIAVEFRTHVFNIDSRKAIERLGAKLDGILRNHMIMPNESLRDTCVYSILCSEWNAVKMHLNWQLDKPR